MSNKVSSLVWDNFNRGGSEKLVMLAFADWSNDQGGSLFPSIASIARKINASESQARRIVHKLIGEGFLVVVGNHQGGKPGQSRQYKMNLKMLETPSTYASRTPSMDATRTPSASATPTPSTDATRTGSTHARDGSHPCQPNHHYPLRACSVEKKPTLAPEKFEVNPEMVQWAISQGIPEDEIKFETEKFLDRNRSKGKRYKDWDATWRNWMRKYLEFSGKKVVV